MEPEILRCGKEFHKRIQDDWRQAVKDGKIEIEHSINLAGVHKHIQLKKTGRLDIFIDESSGFASVIEIKSTNWDRVNKNNITKVLGRHRRQVWNYIEKFLDVEKMDVCPGIIYPKSPSTPGLKDLIENYLNDYGLQVVWYDD